jgi:uncharacterized protein DUF4340
VSPKTLLRIALALGVTLLLWGALALASRSKEDKTPALKLPPVAAAEVDHIVMARPADTVSLSRQADGKWAVDGAPVSAAAVSDFFEALSDSTAATELVAQSAASHSRMGVDSASAKRLTLSGGGKTLLELWIGNRGPDFEGFYVRRPGEDAVYLHHGRFPGLADQRVSDWRDRAIAVLRADSITGVDVTRGRQSWSLRKVSGSWQLAHGAAPDSTALARYLQNLADLQATDFPDRAQADSARFDKPARRLVVLGAGGSTLASLVFDSTYGGFLARAAAGGPLYKVDRNRAESWMPDEATLRKQ